MLNRRTFNLIEAGAERGNAQAQAAAQFISDAIAAAFQIIERPACAEALGGLKLAGDDRAERVADALAVWIKESAPRRFADMTATRYSVSGIDDSADGMERLRNQDEFILLAYPNSETTPDELAAAWIQDIQSHAQPDGFDYDAAEHAIREYVAEATESGYLPAKLGGLAIYESIAADEPDSFDDFEQGVTFRLYVRDNAPESDQ